jgi:hypothetical protein
MRGKYSKQSSPDAWVSEQLQAVSALVVFCDQHYVSEYMEDVRACKHALENRDIAAAISAFRRVPLGGGNGRFDDWYWSAGPTVEANEYEVAVFKALCERWSRLMWLSVDAQDA